MHHKKWSLFAAALCIGLSCTCSATDLYHLQVRVERNGTQAIDTTADIEADDTADLQTFDPANQPTRLTIHIQPQQTSNEVAVQIQYFENRNGDWVLVGEPSLIAALGDEASIQFSSTQSERQELDRYTIALTVKGEGDALVSKSGGCTEGNSSLLDAVGANPKCCWTKQMTCCNVKRRCDNRPGHGDCCDAK